MVVDTYVCGSCAVGGIKNLGEHKNPVDALVTFCKNQLGIKDQFTGIYSKLICYYIFCAGPEVKSDEPGGSHHSKNHWPKYATEFAQFIKDNELGEIVTLGPKLNIKHHKKSTAQVWAWSPNQERMEAWWDTYQNKGRA